VGCADPSGSGTDGPSTPKPEKQINISILLDLSDRIEPTKYPASPEHFKRDIAAVKSVVNYFRADMEEKGAFQAKGKIRVFFSPPPDDENINLIAEQLTVNLADMQTAGKKAVYDSISTWYHNNLQKAYNSVIEAKNYPGADIWRFFKEGRVKDYSIASDPSYRNILVILTDGYMYHDASVDRKGNRTAYVTGPYLSNEGFRNNPDWRQKFKSGDYGLISTGQQLSNLEVLVLEINPSDEHPNDFTKLKAFWSKWFDEMGIDRYRLVKTDLPANTKKTITHFLQGSRNSDM
jgi:hypothetical protein